MPGRKKASSSLKVLLRIGYDERTRFIREYYLSHWTWVSGAHGAITLLFLALWVRLCMVEELSVPLLMGRIGWSVVGFILLLPVHEVIHGAMLWTHGAMDIRFVPTARRAYIRVVAHGHVVGAREIIQSAMMPFVLVTALLAAAIAAYPELRIVWVGVLFLHTLICASDWAQLNFVWHQRERELYSFDDANEQATYYLSATREEDAS